MFPKNETMIYIGLVQSAFLVGDAVGSIYTKYGLNILFILYAVAIVISTITYSVLYRYMKKQLWYTSLFEKRSLEFIKNFEWPFVLLLENIFKWDNATSSVYTRRYSNLSEKFLFFLEPIHYSVVALPSFICSLM